VNTFKRTFGKEGFEDMPIILGGDFNVNVKDNYNVKLVEFMKYTFDPDILSIFLKE
jgi:hypothetical protein